MVTKAYAVGDFFYVKRLPSSHKEIRRREGIAQVYSWYQEGYTIRFLGEDRLFFAEVKDVRPLSHKEREATARTNQFLLNVKGCIPHKKTSGLFV